MRFTIPEPVEHKEGDRRIIRRFLIWPRIVNRELRWLELSYIDQVWDKKYEYETGSGGLCFKYGWIDRSWAAKADWKLWRLLHHTPRFKLF